jgi:hypothetical protein
LKKRIRTFVSDGRAEQAAVTRVLQQVNDWQHLKAASETASKKESPLNKRVPQFWFPHS